MFNVRLAGGYLYEKPLFTWLSLVVSLMASLSAVLFPTGCLGWDLGLNFYENDTNDISQQCY